MPDPAPFDADADTYDDDPHHRLIAERLVAGLRTAPRPGLVVDVATGTGFAALAALAALDPRRILAIDESPRMLAKAAGKAPGADGRIEWRVGPAVPLGVADGAADVVLCASALHLIGPAAPPEWRRVLRPGGQVAFSMPTAAVTAVAPDEAGAAQLAAAAGLLPVRVETTAPVSAQRPRQAFLVWAEAPA